MYSKIRAGPSSALSDRTSLIWPWRPVRAQQCRRCTLPGCPVSSGELSRIALRSFLDAATDMRNGNFQFVGQMAPIADLYAAFQPTGRAALGRGDPAQAGLGQR